MLIFECHVISKKNVYFCILVLLKRKFDIISKVNKALRKKEIRSCGRVARLSSAKAPTAVRIRSGPQ